jgi:hypothetical protein
VSARASGLATSLAAATDRLRLSRAEALAVCLLTLTLAAGAWLRLSHSNWDRGGHLHPDDRYMSIVADNIDFPSSVGRYFDVQKSPLSPYNTPEGQNYVYGTLPLFGTKLAASALGRDDYARLNIVGRRLSAIVDTLSILLVFVLARMYFAQEGARAATEGGLLAAALYAGTVTAIQHAHFFTTDSWLVFFTLLAFTLAVAAVRRTSTRPTSSFPALVLGVGAALGLAAASKISGLVVVVPVAIALLGLAGLGGGRAQALLRFSAAGLSAVVAAYVGFRAVEPYAFAHSSWLDLATNTHLRDALRWQHDAVTGQIIFPPAYQWMVSKRVWAPLENLVVWQLGPALGIAALGGVGLLTWRVARPFVALRRGARRIDRSPAAIAELTGHVMLVIFVVGGFLYFASRFAHTGRYLVPIVPLLCVAAAAAVLALDRFGSAVRLTAAAAVLVPTLLYALAFNHVYAETNTRIAASDWIIQNVPAGSTVVNEHWDDSLPVGGPAGFTVLQLPVFDPDDAGKLPKLYAGLSRADYYVVSSPRAWKTIGRLPDRFPFMTRYYRLLFSERLGFKTAATFRSYPELFGVQLRDLRAEEAFWVYDHPPVTIFRRAVRLSPAEFRRRICEAPPRPLHLSGCGGVPSSS